MNLWNKINLYYLIYNYKRKNSLKKRIVFINKLLDHYNFNHDICHIKYQFREDICYYWIWLSPYKKVNVSVEIDKKIIINFYSEFINQTLFEVNLNKPIFYIRKKILEALEIAKQYEEYVNGVSR